MLELVTSSPEAGKEMLSTLDELARQGARRMLIEALQLEASEYVGRHRDERDENGKALVVGNGKGKERTVVVGCGQINIEAPRVRDNRVDEKFLSKILPPYVRKSPNVESVIPILYLKGLSTGDFQSALSVLFGDGVKGLSPSSIVALKKSWGREYDEWRKRPITEEIVYIWADGVNVNIRLGEDKKLCLLVVIGATVNGDKVLLAVKPGYRESKDSWRDVLIDLRNRGMTIPMLAIADGALGFWAALRDVEGFSKTQEARCWVHKIGNVLDKLPKRLRFTVKKLLHDMMYAETLEQANEHKKRFASFLGVKYPEAVERIEKDWMELTAFFNFPAEHWKHIRSTNPIESSFATVKLRTRVTKGAGSPDAAATMTFKLLQDAEKGWRRLSAPELFKDLRNGVVFQNGIVVTTRVDQEATAG